MVVAGDLKHLVWAQLLGHVVKDTGNDFRGEIAENQRHRLTYKATKYADDS